MKISTTKNIIGQEQQTVNASISELISKSKVNESNFFDCTVASWVDVSGINFKVDHKSESGSQYMYTSEGVYRMADHWMPKTASCVWLLDSKESDKNTVGFCKWEDFKKYGSKRTTSSHMQDYIINMVVYGEMVKSHMLGELTF